LINVENVSRVLYELWDPLNVRGFFYNSSDEYDDWAPLIVEVLNAGGTIDDVKAALDKLLIDVGLRPGTIHDREAAAALIRLRDQGEL
jgi:hypothetical protein